MGAHPMATISVLVLPHNLPRGQGLTPEITCMVGQMYKPHNATKQYYNMHTYKSILTLHKTDFF